ncbi:hypothetical protein YTPLAS18_09320 [Nitrospira sp.]|nr:hypothetical protein YTPLAS18_09320 [Nitrospira sp.]
MAIRTVDNCTNGNLRYILNELTALDFGEPMAGAHRAAILQSLRKLVLLIESMSPRQLGHGRRTADLSHHIGSVAGLSPDELFDLTLAGLLHDIGLLTLPAALLSESHQLSPRELALYQSHPRAGAELLQSISFLRRPALWIAHHHERWDGCGYPYGLRGSFIPQGARILAVADTFDAFLFPAAHQGATADVPAAIGLLRVVGGTQLDPDLVESCASMVLCVDQIDGVM